MTKTLENPSEVEDFEGFGEEILENTFSEDELLSQLCRSSFYDFCREFWSTIIDEEPVWNWHIEFLCNEFQRIAERVFRNEPLDADTTVNISPGTTKTTIISVMLPAWIWTRMPKARIASVSYAHDQAALASVLARDLITSDKYKRLFPEIELRDDTNAKAHYANTLKGYRFACGVDGQILGKHFHFIIVDDPIDPMQAASDAELKAVTRFMERVLPSRKVDKKITPIILIMQRLHENDPTGARLERAAAGMPHRHICLPAELTDDVQPASCRDFYVDGLMDPVRLDAATLERIEQEQGDYVYAGQYLQRPIPEGTAMFHVGKINIVDHLPKDVKIVREIRFWDKACSTNDDSAWTVGARMGVDSDGHYWWLHVKRARMDSWSRERTIRNTAAEDRRRCEIGVEQEPGPIWEEESVQMGDGSRKKLKDVSIGDMVIGKNGRTGKVTAVHEQGELECLRLETDSGRTVYTAYEHPFWTPQGWVNAGDLAVGDTLALRSFYSTTPASVRTEEEARLAGYFVGDGCCTFVRRKGVETNGVNSMVTCSDPLQGRDIIRCAESVGARWHIGGNEGWTYYLSGGVKKWLWDVGLAGKRTENKEVPEWVMSGTDEIVAGFIGAFFACDGCVSVSKGVTSIEFYNTSRKLLEQIQSLLLRLGIFARLRVRNYTSVMQSTRKAMYRLLLRKGDDSQGRFASMVPVYGAKADKLNHLRMGDFPRTMFPDRVVRIEQAGRMPCRCLTVDGESSFLVNDIIVSNSGGKHSAEYTARALAGYKVHIVGVGKSDGDKVTRAYALSSQVNAGNTSMLRGDWNAALINELRFFPNSKYKDQVDASSGAFNILSNKKRVLGGRGTFQRLARSGT